MCSSRAICAQLVLVNTSMFKFIESPNSPYVRSLVSWVQFHTEKDRLIDIDEPTAKSGESPATSVTGSVTKAANVSTPPPRRAPSVLSLIVVGSTTLATATRLRSTETLS